MPEDEDLRLVYVIVATCNKCGGALHTCVKKYMDRATSREFAKHLEAGCSVYTTNVVVARTIKWCKEAYEGMYPKKLKTK